MFQALSLNLSSERKLYVSHYGHPQLKGAKHWALVLMKNNKTGKAYQVTGSTTNYIVKEPETVEPEKSRTFMGMVQVGVIPNKTKNRERFEEVLRTVPVVRGDVHWNCQNWIVDALRFLREDGFEIEDISHQVLLQRLNEEASSIAA